MEKRTNYLNVVVDTGATTFALEHLRMYPLNLLQRIIVCPDGHGFTDILFEFDTKPNFGYSVMIKGGFCVGYRGEGPWGLHDIMIEAGFSKEVAEKVFVIPRDEKTVLEK